MSRRITKSASTDFTMGELVETFEGVLKDFDVVSKSDVEAMIDTKLSKAEEGGVGSIEDVEETKAEANTYDLQDLQELLPEEVWEVVRTYLAGDGTDLPDDIEGSEPGGDVEKAVNSAITTSGESLNRVRGNATAPVSKSDSEPSYESTEDAEGSESDMLLKHLDEALGAPTGAVSKSDGKDKPDHPTLTHIDRADL